MNTRNVSTSFVVLSFVALATFVMLALPILSVNALSSDDGFSDVPTSHPNFTAIEALREQGVIGGYSDGTFRPDQAVNRVEALKIVLLGAGVDTPETTAVLPFLDTGKTEWYAKYLAKAYALKIVAGNPDGTFRPENQVNLAESLKIIINANGLSIDDLTVTENPYADVLTSDWYAGFFQYAKDRSWITPDTGNRIFPAQKMTRGMLVQLMYFAADNATVASQEQPMMTVHDDNSNSHIANSPAGTLQEPYGIYILDSTQGTWHDANIRDYDFVAGYALRLGWGDFETSQDTYDFSGVDHILSELHPLSQKLSLLLFSYNLEPAYLAQEPGVTTWTFTDQNPRHTTYGQSYEKVLPWDEFVQERYRLFLENLAEHPTPTISGQTVALRDNPTLTHLNLGLPGIGSIREGVGAEAPPEISDLPGYTREKLITGILGFLESATDNFPNTPISVSFFPVTDDTTTPPLWKALHEAIEEEFNSGSTPRVGYFMENLSASKSGSTVSGQPVPQFATPLAAAFGNTFVTFQMLQSWLQPFANPAKTAGSVPTDAIEFAHETYGTRYFELYVPDIDNTEWHPLFEEWADLLAS